MIQSIDLSAIAWDLSSEIGFTIFDGVPFQEVTDSVYWFMRIVSETVENITSKLCVVELTIIAKPWQDNKKIRQYITDITNIMLGDNCIKKAKYGDFYVYGIEDGAFNWPWYTEKKETVFTKQYSFRFLRTT